MCETDAEYAVLIEDNQFIAVAKTWIMITAAHSH